MSVMLSARLFIIVSSINPAEIREELKKDEWIAHNYSQVSTSLIRKRPEVLTPFSIMLL